MVSSVDISDTTDAPRFHPPGACELSTRSASVHASVRHAQLAEHSGFFGGPLQEAVGLPLDLKSLNCFFFALRQFAETSEARRLDDCESWSPSDFGVVTTLAESKFTLLETLRSLCFASVCYARSGTARDNAAHLSRCDRRQSVLQVELIDTCSSSRRC